MSSVKSRRLISDALDSASGVVRISYGSTLAALLLVAFRPIANAMHRFTLGMLLPTLVAGGLIGLALSIRSRSFGMRVSGFWDSENAEGRNLDMP